MIEAVIFDMDGLLVDSEPVWFLARKDLLEGHGKVWTEADQLAMAGVHTQIWVDAVGAMAGVHTQIWVDAVGDKLEGRLSPEQVLEEILDRMERFYANGDVAVLTGADEALEVCAGRYRVGLASGSPRRLIDAALRGAGWAMHFENLISGDELEHGKPEPDIYLEIMRRMNLDAARTAVVEDSGAGIRAGKAAGTKVIAVPNSHTMPSPGVLALADACIDSLHAVAGSPCASRCLHRLSPPLAASPQRPECQAGASRSPRLARVSQRVIALAQPRPVEKPGLVDAAAIACGAVSSAPRLLAHRRGCYRYRSLPLAPGGRPLSPRPSPPRAGRRRRSLE